jgi:hypothetical protein
MESNSLHITWWEPRWSIAARYRNVLTRWRLLSPWMWVRLFLLCGGLAVLGLYLVHRAGAGAPLPSGLVRAALFGALGFPVLLLFNVVALMAGLHLVSVGASGISVDGPSSLRFKAENLQSVTVDELDHGQFVLRIEYRFKKGVERVDIGLSSKVDPVKIEGLLERLAFPAPVLNPREDSSTPIQSGHEHRPDSPAGAFAQPRQQGPPD